ncbi:MAG: hypothetical protein NZ874_05050 [Fimbriimonadales bacterium]|nr:hypothetical protein [Fimbriimonadales bacterium]
MAAQPDDFAAFLRLLDAHPEWIEALQERIVDEKAILRVLDKNAEVRDAVRRRILQEEFLQLPALIRQLIEAQQRSEAQLQEHNRILQRHGELIQQLIEAQQHTEAQVQEVVTVLQQILLQVQDLSEARQRFDDWIRGEEGRRRGEQLERMTVRRATTIFGGGRGGSPEQAHVQQQLLRWLRRVRDAGLAYNPDADPTLSDLLWWKGDRVLVGEVSVKVDASDILRARQRADTLRRAQVDAIPIVIGEDWANEELREIAQQQGVEWFVPPEVSQGVVAFRKIEEGEEENGRGRRRRVR